MRNEVGVASELLSEMGVAVLLVSVVGVVALLLSEVGVAILFLSELGVGILLLLLWFCCRLSGASSSDDRPLPLEKLSRLNPDAITTCKEFWRT